MLYSWLTLDVICELLRLSSMYHDMGPVLGIGEKDAASTDGGSGNVYRRDRIHEIQRPLWKSNTPVIVYRQEDAIHSSSVKT